MYLGLNTNEAEIVKVGLRCRIDEAFQKHSDAGKEDKPYWCTQYNQALEVYKRIAGRYPFGYSPISEEPTTDTLEFTAKRWNELSFAEQQIFCGSYGQTLMFDQVWLEANIDDERLAGDNDLPWDAVAEVIERNGHRFLQLTGSQGPSGYGCTWSILLPEDVKLHFRIWKNNR